MKNKPTIFATMNGVDGVNGVPGVSGGDVRILKILKNWSKKSTILLSTSNMGATLAKAYGIDFELKTIKGPAGSGIFVNLIKVLSSILVLPRRRVTLAYSGGEHLYDVVAPALLKTFRGIPWVAVVHWVEEYPWRDRRGGTPIIHRYLYWLNRVLAMWLIKMGADKILAVSNSTREKLISRRGIDPDRVATVYCGIDLTETLQATLRGYEKTYDAIFMKRLNYGKGVRDLVEIWAKVCESIPRAKLQIIGDGPPFVLSEIAARIKQLGLSENIDLVGVVHDQEEKLERLLRSKLFILPSHEENWAIVIGEALAAGLPVVAYDLKEIRPLWGEHVSWIPFGNVEAFASEVTRQLAQPRRVELDDFLRNLDWNRIAEVEYKHAISLLRIDEVVQGV